MVAIINHNNLYGNMNWDSNTVVIANGLLKSYSSVNFIYTFVITMNCMSVIKPLSIKLQYRTNGIVYAYSNVIGELKSIRANEQLLQLWYEQVLSVADEVDAEPRVPRTVGYQLGRDNMEHNSAEDYYRWTISIAIAGSLDSPNAREIWRATNTSIQTRVLRPSFLCTDSTVNLDEVLEFYHDDLPNPSVVGTEISRWKFKWLHQGCL